MSLNKSFCITLCFRTSTAHCKLLPDCTKNNKHNLQINMMHVTRKQTLRSLSLSYCAHPSFGKIPTFQNLTLLTS